MKCRSLKTIKTRELHIKRGEVYEYSIFHSSRSRGQVNVNGIVVGDDSEINIYLSALIRSESGQSFTTNMVFFKENFITQGEERENKLNHILSE